VRSIVFTFVLSIILFFCVGCLGPPEQFAADNDEYLKNLFDTKARIEQQGTCRIKYHNLWNTARFMVVEGSFANGTKNFPVILDTGASQPVFVKGSHVRGNHLPISSAKENVNGFNIRGCSIPTLRLGDICLVDWPAFYLEQKFGLNLFGFLTGEDNSVILGLPALRHFKYIVFDSVLREVEFSSEKSFEPIQANMWQKYPFTIEEDLNGNAFLFVELPVAGQRICLQLDTGSGNGLAIRRSLWEKICPNIPSVRVKKGSDLYPYIGRLNCEKAVISELPVCDRLVKNAQVSVFADDCPLLDESDALLGMQYFFDTAIALDFENGLLWVKK
jgi:hypothetical protein